MSRDATPLTLVGVQVPRKLWIHHPIMLHLTRDRGIGPGH
jgi:hypothetical protein